MNTKIDQINFCYLGLLLHLELCPTRNSLAKTVDTGTSPCNNRSSIGVDSVAKNLRSQGRLNVNIRLSRDFSMDVGLCRDFLVNIRNSLLRSLLPELSSAGHALTKTVDTGSSPGNSRTSISVDSVTENLRGQSRLNVHIGLSRDFNMDIGLCWDLLVQIGNSLFGPLLSELGSAGHTLAQTVNTTSSPGKGRSGIGVDSVAKNLRGQGRLNVHIWLSRDFCVDVGLGWNLLVYVRKCSLRPLLSSSSSRPLGNKVLISLLL